MNSHIEISVADIGHRHHARVLCRYVFERFRQEGGSSNPPGQGGLGLGLAIVRQLVEQHGGTVQATSAGDRAAGRPSPIHLPLTVAMHRGTAQEERAGIPKSPEHPSRWSSRESTCRAVKVLVVDDEDDARDLITRVLAGVPRARVVTAGTAASEALAAVEARPPGCAR